MPTSPVPLSEVPAEPAGHGLLAGRSVVVTAAAGSGIGSATARRCLVEGARVLVSDLHERRLAEAADALEADFPGQVSATACDVTDEGSVEALIEAAVRAHGGLDVVVNNAGLGGTSTILDTSDSMWAKILDVSLTSVFRVTRASFRAFARQGTGGVVVNNASVSGWRAQEGQAAYAAAKAGVMAFTRCAAVEGVPLGVRVNAVAPSLAAHPFLARSAPQDLLDDLARRELFGRGAEPWEVANVIVFLASGYSSYLSGEVVSVSSQRA